MSWSDIWQLVYMHTKDKHIDNNKARFPLKVSLGRGDFPDWNKGNAADIKFQLNNSILQIIMSF